MLLLTSDHRSLSKDKQSKRQKVLVLKLSNHSDIFNLIHTPIAQLQCLKIHSKLSSDAWYSSNEAEIGQFTDLGKQFEMIKSQLILYHDDNELSLKTLVDFWNDSSSLTTLVAFGYAQKMYAIACTAVELGDFHAAKCNILAAGKK